MQGRCPTCKKTTEFSSENPFRPFCSERCRLVDLGNWLDEAYRIPEREDEEEDQELVPRPSNLER